MAASDLGRHRRCAEAIVLVAAATAFAAARSAEAASTPAISIATKAIELTVTIDSTLRLYPWLYDNLFAEARHDSAKWHADAEAANPSLRERSRWFHARNYTLRSVVAQHYVSVLRVDDTYEGGAHPNSVVNTILWDAWARKRISIRPFFLEAVDNGPTMTVLATSIRAALIKERKARGAEVADNPDKDPWLASIKPHILNLGPVTLAPSTEKGKSSGLTFHFSPYAAGAYAEGTYTAFVPWTDFKGFLSPAGVSVFDGERPTQDAEKD